MSPSPFRFHVPVAAFEKGLPDGRRSKRIGGLVTSPNRDRQGEEMLLDGLDFADFQDSGWFNDNHGKSTTDVVGLPDAAVKRVHKGQLLPHGDHAKTDGYWAEGILVGPKGDQVWQLAKDLEGTGRSLGFSVEGVIKERDLADPRKITKAKVRQIAVTHCPVNADTELVMLSKALEAGTDIVNPGAVPGNGFAIRAESLDREPKYLIYGKPPKDGKKRKKGSPENGTGTTPLTAEEGVAALKSRWPTLGEGTARWIYEVARSLKAQGALG